MRTTKTIHAISKAALMLIVMLTMTLTASATDFITDVMVAGNKDQTDFNSLISSLVSAGWSDTNQDLNQNAGGAYIHLLYKKQSSTGNTGTPITGFYIWTGSNPPDNLTFEGRTYYLVPCQGSETFVNGHGDLNSGCGSGSAYIYLYYTKDALSNNTGVTAITFNTTQNSAVGANGGTTGYDLNTGCGSNSAYIYMHITTATGGNVVMLTSGSGDVQLLNGHILAGTGGADTRVSVTDGATVTFNGVNLTAITNNSSHSWPGIHCLGNATIVLNGGTTNSVSGGFRSPGIYVAANKTLTIQGSGTLTATGRDFAAGIGSGENQSSCGNITITGGTITATGGQNATGIGSGVGQSCGAITISGGTVNATGLTYAAGIGSGYENASCGAITISGGTVTAAGGLYAAAIGSGYQSSCGTITITNGVTCVTATKHNNSAYSVGAGNNGSSVTVTVGGVQTGSIQMSPFVTYPYTVHFDPNGGTGTMANQSFMYNVSQNLTANTFTNGGRQFMGWATTATGPKAYNDGQRVSNLTQSAGATVTLYAKWANKVTLASEIGEILLQDGDTLTGTGGQNTRVKIADGATVTFSGANITTIAENTGHQWPGIHCLGNATIILKGGTTNSVKGGYHSCGIHIPQGKSLIIQGSGTLNVTGGDASAGIGSGQNQSSCGNITISGGTIIANGGQNASGIGSGYNNASCGNITISGGTVNATGLTYAAGIGSGYNNSSCGNITISGGTVTANGGFHAAGIGSGYDNASCGNITITDGVTCVTATKTNGNYSVGAGNSSSCGTVTIGNVQTGSISMSPFVTYPYTISFNANGGTGTMTNQVFMYNVAQNLTSNAFTYMDYVFLGWATSANGTKVYDDGQSVSNLTQTAGATVTLYAKWMLNPDHLSVEGNTYTIHTATGWNIFCNLLAANSNGYFTGKTVKLDNNISVTNMAGSSGHEFSGTFDGQGHTLTVNYQNTDGAVRTAPFSYINGATIQNLIVTGSITGTGNRAAGIVGETGSSLSHITNCVSSVNVSGGDYTGGISIGGNMEITGCVFNGKITGTSMSGGFVGSYNSALVISNSLFDPQADSSISGGTFYYNDGGEITLNNSYYTMPLGTSQGKQARSIVGGDDVTVTFNGQATTYNTSGITAYSVGMVYGDTLYAGNGDTVSLNLSCTPPSGYVYSGYTTSAGTLSGTVNPYTLDMPDEAVTIQALEQVAYIDSDGQTLTCGEYTVLTGNETTLEAGWYVVNRDITYDSTLTLAGDVTLILCDGKTMTVTTDSGRSINGLFSLIEGCALTVYGQTLDSETAGTLDVTNNDENNDAIELGTYTQHSGKVTVNDSNGVAINTWDDFTLNGGTVNATGYYGISTGFYAVIINGGTVNATGGGASISATDLIINGGTVNVSTHKGLGIDAINVTINGGTVNSTNGSGIGANNVTINGGTVNATHGRGIEAYHNVTINGGTVTANEIYSPTTTLGWSNLTDCITVGSFDHWSTFTVSVKSGQAFCYQNGNETVIVSDTLDNDQINAIGGKTLRPLTPVSYVDGNGEMHTCGDYTVLTGGGATTLTEGWYVVDDNITYTGTLTLAGDVTLILCNGKTMTVNSDSGESIYGLINIAEGFAMTVYGQTLDSNMAGTLHVTNNVENYTAIELTTYTQHSGNVVVSDSNDMAISAGGDFTLNGGTINATGNFSGFSASNVTLNSGIVTALGSNYGIYADDNLTLNGGTINATGSYAGIFSDGDVTLNGGTVTTNSIFSAMVTLGWSNLTDCFTIGNFDYAGTFTVSVKSGQAFCYQNGNETVIISGTLNSDQINAIGGKTLRPLTPVSYVDGSGNPYSCGDYTVLKGSETTLEAGWYVVNNDITYDSTLTLNGNVNLILCNGKTMTVDPGSGNSISGDTLTIYGQTLDSVTAGTLYVTDTVESKRAIKLSTYTQHSGNVEVNDSSDFAISVGDFTLNGGTVNATSTNYCGISAGNVTLNGGTVNATGSNGIDGGNVTINGGTVNANGDDYGIYSESNVTINGGTVNATGDTNGIGSANVTINGGTVNATAQSYGISTNNVIVNGGSVTANNIFAPTVTLGWSDLTDCITVGGFGYWDTFTVSVKSGQAFCYQNGNDTVIIRGTLNSDQIEAISGKTLRPYTLLVTQTVNLVGGEWNWFSAYVHVSDSTALLEMLKTGMGDNVNAIESIYGMNLFDEDEWLEDFDFLTNVDMYLIEAINDCTFELQGMPVNPADHPITIYPQQWNLIGFPCTEVVNLVDALAGFNAEEGDQVEGIEGITEYDGEEWFDAFDMTPGHCYLYWSNSNEVRTLTIQTGSSKAKK